MNQFFIWLVLLPSKLYTKMGVNVDHLRSILAAKLMMDDRRPNAMHYAKRKTNKKPVNMATLGAMLLMAIFGIMFIIPFFITQDTVTQFTIYFSFFLFILVFTLISDFTSVLIDVRDNNIILPKPISDKTFLLSRLLHIVIHISKLVIPLNLAALITIGIQKGLPAVGCVLLLLPFATILTIFIINALYIFILKVTTPDKFKSIISYFQIGFAIMMYASYQVIPRMLNMTMFKKFQIQENGWILFAPSYWFAAAFKLLQTGQGSLHIIIGAIFSIVIPLLAIWAVIKYFAPAFNQKLAMISGSDQSEKTKVISTKGVGQAKKPLVQKLASIFTNTNAESMGFTFTWLMTSRSRDFKLKTFPSIGYFFVYLFIIIFTNKKFSLAMLQGESKPTKILVLACFYMVSFILFQVLTNLNFSEKYKASWFFGTAPIQTPGEVINGAVKAMLFKFFIPFALVISTFLLVVVGVKLVPNILLGMSNQILLCYLATYLNGNSLPFTKSEASRTKGGTFARSLFAMIIPICIGIVHYFIFSNTIVVIISLLLSVLAVWLLMDGVAKKSWSNLKYNYSEIG